MQTPSSTHSELIADARNPVERGENANAEQELAHILGRLDDTLAANAKLHAMNEAMRSSAALHGKQKDQLLAIMAHELKHPLNLIHMHAEVLLRQEEVRCSPPLARAVAAMRSASISQAKIINELLDMARVSTGKMHLKTSRVDLCELVETIAGVIGQTHQGPRIALHLTPYC
jgi:two-component system CheB/CheR fusion protein